MAFWRKAAKARGRDHELNNDIAYNNNIHLLPYLYDQSSQNTIQKYNNANLRAQCDFHLWSIEAISDLKRLVNRFESDNFAQFDLLPSLISIPHKEMGIFHSSLHLY